MNDKIFNFNGPKFKSFLRAISQTIFLVLVLFIIYSSLFYFINIAVKDLLCLILKKDFCLHKKIAYYYYLWVEKRPVLAQHIKYDRYGTDNWRGWYTYGSKINNRGLPGHGTRTKTTTQTTINKHTLFLCKWLCMGLALFTFFLHSIKFFLYIFYHDHYYY